jgi:hypothetical protein
MKQNYILPQKKAISTTPLKEVIEPTYGETGKVPTRADTRRASANGSNAADALEVFNTLNDVLFMNELSEIEPLSPARIDNLALELIAVRNAKDIVEGREAAIKAYATEIINLKIEMNGEDPSSSSGYLVSPDNGVKLSKEVTGGKLTVDIDLLEKVLDPDQFHLIVNLVETQVTTTRPDGSKLVEESKVYELNEEALEKELKLGNIGMEQVVKATVPGKARSAFYVRSL